MKVSWDDYSQDIQKQKKCSKPPARWSIPMVSTKPKWDKKKGYNPISTRLKLAPIPSTQQVFIDVNIAIYKE